MKAGDSRVRCCLEEVAGGQYRGAQTLPHPETWVYMLAVTTYAKEGGREGGTKWKGRRGVKGGEEREGGGGWGEDRETLESML